MKLALTVLGTRPEITKLSPLIPLLDAKYRHVLVHTGQHYDANMDAVFFRDLHLRAPDHMLRVGSASHGKQTAEILLKLEPILQRLRPDFVLVQGDTNSALAGALAAAKLQIPIVHVEAGCRSFNRGAPEEINRIMIDHISDVLCAPDAQALQQLRREGLADRALADTGNTSLDAARRMQKFLKKDPLVRIGVEAGKYILATLHRAENTDREEVFRGIMGAWNSISKEARVVFPIHPRTRKLLQGLKFKLNPGILLVEPMGYIDFLSLMNFSRFVMSDSGGIQEEAAVLNRACLILREETEWKRLVRAKKNFLLGTGAEKICAVALDLIRHPKKLEAIRRRKAPLSYGADKRILALLAKKFA